MSDKANTVKNRSHDVPALVRAFTFAAVSGERIRRC